MAAVLLWTGSPNFSVQAFTSEQKLIAEAWRVIDQGYLDRTFNKQDWFKIRMKAVKRQYGSREEAYQTIKKMVASLDDPYTRFLYPEQLESLTSTTTGDVAGIGVELYPARAEGKLQILNVEESGPAARNGVRPNDYIREIDGEETTELTPDEAAARIRGTPNTQVTLTLYREKNGGGDEVDVKIKREQLRIKSLKYTIMTSPENKKVGYLKLKSFNTNTAEDAKKALEELRGAGAEEYVLDLRNNPGGYFPAGVEVARLFLDQGATVAYVINSRGIEDAYVSSMPTIAKEPLVVLVNKATASASEVLAGALKDNGRAVLVGEKTFGKGVVQTITPLSDGSGLAVTIAKYETPNHNNVNKVGILPDLIKPCDGDEIAQCLPEGF